MFFLFNLINTTCFSRAFTWLHSRPEPLEWFTKSFRSDTWKCVWYFKVVVFPPLLLWSLDMPGLWTARRLCLTHGPGKCLCRWDLHPGLFWSLPCWASFYNTSMDKQNGTTLNFLAALFPGQHRLPLLWWFPGQWVLGGDRCSLQCQVGTENWASGFCSPFSFLRELPYKLVLNTT